MFKQKNANFPKLKSNLRLCIQRLKLLEKKKTELALKARKDIADYMSASKDDRARIRVEHIVREDYLVEAMEILEMYCDMLLARFGMIEKIKEMDPGLEEPVASLIWAAPRLMADVPELNVVALNLTAKYGKEFGEACRANKLGLVNEKVLHKMSIYAPPKHLIESYMIEIAKAYNIPFIPDPAAFQDVNELTNTGVLIDFGLDSSEGSDFKKGGPGNGAGGGGHNVAPFPEKQIPVNPNPADPSAPPELPELPRLPGDGSVHTTPFNYPPPAGAVGGPAQHPGYPGAVYPHQNSTGTGYPPQNPAGSFQLPPYSGENHSAENLPPQPPSYDATMSVSQNPPVDINNIMPSFPQVPGSLPELPQVPGSLPGGAGNSSAGGEDVDFDDLTKRFEELKKKK